MAKTPRRDLCVREERRRSKRSRKTFAPASAGLSQVPTWSRRCCRSRSNRRRLRPSWTRWWPGRDRRTCCHCRRRPLIRCSSRTSCRSRSTHCRSSRSWMCHRHPPRWSLHRCPFGSRRRHRMDRSPPNHSSCPRRPSRCGWIRTLNLRSPTPKPCPGHGRHRRCCPHPTRSCPSWVLESRQPSGRHPSHRSDRDGWSLRPVHHQSARRARRPRRHRLVAPRDRASPQHRRDREPPAGCRASCHPTRAQRHLPWMAPVRSPVRRHPADAPRGPRPPRSGGATVPGDLRRPRSRPR
jgi:hypothetical protein